VVKTLTPAEQARRAAVLGIVLPGPAAPLSSPPAPQPNGKARAPIAGKLTASPALRAKLGIPVAEPPPQSNPNRLRRQPHRHPGRGIRDE